MSGEVFINVSGTIFITKWSTLQKYQNTLLGSLNRSSEYYNHEKQYYFFDRNPEMFITILDFYRNGHIHLPTHICGYIWKQELDFWQIPVTHISECCFPTFSKYDKNRAISEYMKQTFTVQTTVYKTNDISCIHRLKQRVWLFLDEPRSSIPARIFSILYLVAVLLSSVIPILITHPDVREHVIDIEILKRWAVENGLNLWINTENPKEVLFVTSVPPKWVTDLNIMVMAFFSVHIWLKFLCCPSKVHFFKDWLNTFDILLFLPMWMSYILEQYPEKLMASLELTILYAVCYCTVAFRLIRIFRIAKQYSSLRILLMAIRESLKELCLLVMTFTIFVLLFANLMYFAEFRDPTSFPNMVIGLWYSVVTMTTVGYGDIVPNSALGRAVGSFCAMCGLLLLAMPIAVIAGKFNDLHRHNEDIEQFNNIHTVKEPGRQTINRNKVFTISENTPV